MRRAVFTLCILLCTTLSGRTREEAGVSIFTDIGSAVGGRKLTFGFSHRLSPHWSVGGGCSFNVPHIRWSEEEKEHSGSLGKELRTGGGGFPELQAGFRYWPGRFCEGWYMEGGCSYAFRGDADIILGCGYTVKIWKGLGFGAGYGLRLFESLKAGTLGPQGITIGIFYTF